MSQSATHRYQSFRDFYPYYLSEHSDRTCRRLHFVGTLLVILIAVAAAATGRPSLLWLLPIVGYGFAWVGHFRGGLASASVLGCAAFSAVSGSSVATELARAHS